MPNKNWQIHYKKKLKIIIMIIKYFVINYMETISFFSTIFIGCMLISMTVYSVYIGFGPTSNKLRDPFEEHED